MRSSVSDSIQSTRAASSAVNSHRWCRGGSVSGMVQAAGSLVAGR